MWLKLTETLYFMAKTKLENDHSFLQILPETTPRMEAGAYGLVVEL